MLVGLGAHEGLSVHAKGRNRGDAKLAGPQPILIDGRLEGLGADNLIQLLPLQPDRIGRRRQGFDLVKVLPIPEIGPEHGVVESIRFPMGLRPFGRLLGTARVEAHAALAERQPQAAGGLFEPLQHLRNVEASPGEQALERDPFGRDLRVQRKSRPVQIDPELLFQSFTTPGNEIAPGSDEIRKNLQDVIIFSFHFQDPF